MIKADLARYDIDQLVLSDAEPVAADFVRDGWGDVGGHGMLKVDPSRTDSCLGLKGE